MKKLAEDMEEVQTSLNFISEKISKVAKQQMGLLDLLVRQLKAVIKEKDKKIEELERRVTRMDDLLISGLETTHHTYARVTARDKEGEDAPNGELQSLQQFAISYLKDKGKVQTSPFNL